MLCLLCIVKHPEGLTVVHRGTCGVCRLHVRVCAVQACILRDMTAHAVRYGPCEAGALQERMKRAVALLGEAEVKAILEKEGRIEVWASAL